MTAFESMNRPDADQERDAAKDSEAAIDEAPRNRNASDRSGDESERNDACTGNQAELDDPLVPYRVNIRTDERDGDDKVRKRQPIGAIRQEGITRVCLDQCGLDSFKPREQMNGLNEGEQGACAE